MSRQKPRLWAVVFLLFVAMAGSVYAVSAARHESATFDEPTYVIQGLECWRTHSYKRLMRLGTMPLPIDVQTLPIYLWEKVRPGPFALSATENGKWMRDTDLHRVLPVARGMTLVFWWLLLVYVFRLARQTAGASPCADLAACWAVGIVGFDPTFLAHAGLATTDIAVAAFTVAFAFHFAAGRAASWPRRLLVPALWLAGAGLAKVSGLIFGGVIMLSYEALSLYQARLDSPPWRARVKPVFQNIVRVSLLAVLLAFLYVRSDFKTEPTFVSWAGSLHPGPLRSVMAPLSRHLKIFSNAGEGIVQQVKHNIRGQRTFLLGRTYPRAIWYYFPVLLTIKLALPVLLLPLVLLVSRVKKAADQPSTWNGPLLAAGVLVLYSLTFHVQIGIRFLLPVIALGVVGVTAGLSQTAGANGWRKSLAYGTALVAIVWNAGASLAVWPDPLRYTSFLWGGERTGYQLMHDSNYDWGQGVPQLVTWARAHAPRSAVDVWYFGTDPLANTPPLRVLNLSLAADNKTPEDVRRACAGKWVAVSTTLLDGPQETPAHGVAQQFFATQRSVDRTNEFLIYDFNEHGTPLP